MKKGRRISQVLTTLLYNFHLKGLFTGSLYKGVFKGICVPGLQCYSCPASVGSCPLGALQMTITGIKRGLNTYVLGTILLFAAAFGRVICGFLCPFGFLQELLFKIPIPKSRISLRKVSFLKYIILALFVLGIPLITTLTMQGGFPAFCKWICPSGTLAGTSLLLLREDLRSLAGITYFVKVALLILFLVSFIRLFRPFCRVLCPLGAIYGLFNSVALVRLSVESHTCTHCGACEKACPVELKPETECNHKDCLRCGKCKEVCPTGSISYKVGYDVKKKLQE